MVRNWIVLNQTKQEIMTNTHKPIKIVIVEDDVYYNKLLTKYVHTICSGSFYPDLTFDVKSYYSAHECIEELENDLDIILLDYFLFNKDEDEVLNGADVLGEVKKHCNDCKVIMMSTLKSAGKAAELISQGLYAYVDKNINSKDRIGAVLQQAIEDR